MPSSKLLVRSAALAVLSFLLTSFSWGLQISRLDRELVGSMLKNVSGDLKKHYYDPKLHGIDWDAKAVETKEKIDKATAEYGHVSPGRLAGCLR
jgi:hypothetical protein